MMKPHNVTFHLAAAFCLLAAVLAVVGWLGISHLRGLNRQIQNVVFDRWEEQLLSHQAYRLSSQNNQITMLIFLLDDPDKIQQLLTERAANTRRITDLADIIEARLDTEKEKRLFATVQMTRTPYVESYQRALSLLLNDNQREEARKMMVEAVLPNLTAYHNAWDEFNQCEADEINEVMRQSKVDFAAEERHFLLLLALAGAFVCALAFLTVRHMHREITIRKRTEQSLHHARDGLEARVAERTAELAIANEALRVENAERKQAEASLLLLGSAVEQTKESIVITDAELDLPGPKIIFVNSAFTKITGYDGSEVIGKTPRILQGPRTDRAVFNRLRETLKTGMVFEGETINYRKDGTEFYLEWQIAPLRDAGGKITHFVAIQRDSTARKQAENALRESNEKFHQLADNITDVFWIRSPDLSEVQYLSPAFERIWGRPVKTLLANPHQWGDYILPEDRERVLAAFAALTGNQRSVDIQYRINRPDGEVRWVHVRGFQVRDANDRLIRHTGIVTDITERKRLESLMLQSEARYRSLIDNARDAIFTIAADGSFTSLNPAVEAIAKLSRADWLGKPFAPMVHPDDQPLAREMFQRVLKGEQVPVHELRGHPGLARPALMEMTLTAQKDESGKIIGVLGIGRDMTDRKRLEAQLIQSQKLETVGKLAGGIAHEFNSILTAIIGQSELLLGDLPAGSPLARNAAEVTKAANRAATLTRQLLAYGRKQILQPEILDLNAVLAGMESTLRHLMGHNTDIYFAPATGLKLVKADAGQIEQVIMNLVMNAEDAMPNGGKLMLETANVSFDEDSVGRYSELKPGDYVMLAITDTGTGMNGEVKARVFEPFFTTKEVGQGTGLGLSTSYGIIKQSGGHISVYSEAGRGSTFKIYLPQIEPRVPPPARRLDSPGLPRGTETILLVEDDPALREMAATLLRRLGYTVLTAANGLEALNVKQERGTGHIDLLFTDVVMPHMSGKELADRIHALYPLTKILFTSAYTENAIVHQGVLAPGVALLQKPFTPSTLANKLRAVLDQPGAPKSIGT